jgi:hypothetical protein
MKPIGIEDIHNNIDCPSCLLGKFEIAFDRSKSSPNNYICSNCSLELMSYNRCSLIFELITKIINKYNIHWFFGVYEDVTYINQTIGYPTSLLIVEYHLPIDITENQIERYLLLQ